MAGRPAGTYRSDLVLLEQLERTDQVSPSMIWHLWDGQDVAEDDDDGTALGTTAVMQTIGSAGFLQRDRGASGADFVDFMNTLVEEQRAEAAPLRKTVCERLGFPLQGCTGGQTPGCGGHSECGGSELCLAGTCQAIHGRRYRLTVVSAELCESDGNGAAWDVWGGPPDSFAVVFLDGTEVAMWSVCGLLLVPSGALNELRRTPRNSVDDGSSRHLRGKNAP